MLQTLPKELLVFGIAKFCQQERDILCLFYTCSKLYKLIEHDENFWQARCCMFFGETQSNAKSKFLQALNTNGYVLQFLRPNFQQQEQVEQWTRTFLHFEQAQSNLDAKPGILVKLVVLGARNVGKSQLLRVFAGNKFVEHDTYIIQNETVNWICKYLCL